MYIFIYTNICNRQFDYIIILNIPIIYLNDCFKKDVVFSAVHLCYTSALLNVTIFKHLKCVIIYNEFKKDDELILLQHRI